MDASFGSVLCPLQTGHLDKRDSSLNGSLPVPLQNAHFTLAVLAAIGASAILLCLIVAFIALFRLPVQFLILHCTARTAPRA